MLWGLPLGRPARMDSPVNLDHFYERLQQLLTRVTAIPWYEVVVELAIIWFVVYLVFRFLRGTRGARVIKGMALILVTGTLIIKTLTGENAFERLNFLYGNFVGFASLMLVIVFQPELRRALVRIGEARLFRQGGLRRSRVIEEILNSIAYLSKNKIGALIAIERQVGLRGIIEAGTRVDAEVSAELLNTIFWPGSALHDMGVIVVGDRVAAAGAQFPLAEGEGIGSDLGSRHRAAIGLSQEADCLIIVVSEETGIISVAERGQLVRNLTIDQLRANLTRGIDNVRLTSDDLEDEAPKSEAA
jgi:diadenylate cyclase